MSEETKNKNVLRTTVTDRCPTCPNKELYSELVVQDGIDEDKIPNPHMMMITASPLCVCIVEMKKDERHSFGFYRCNHRECLMVHLKETMLMNFIQKKAEEDHKNMDQARLMALARHKGQNSSGRRANKRRKAKELAKKKKNGKKSNPSNG